MSWWIAIGVVAAAAAAAVLMDGFKRLAGEQVPSVRLRAPGLSDEEWLMGTTQAERAELGLPGKLIRTSFSSAAVREWEASETYSV
jgi:hypothetical protein